MNELKDNIYNTVSNRLVPLSGELRSSAASAGWPANIAQFMTVEMKNNSIEITYPDEFRDVIHELEYGTETRRPTAVIRRFMNRMDSKLGGNE